MRAHLRPANVRLLSAAALLGGLSETTQDTPEEWLMRWRAYETLHISKMTTYQPDPCRRSKRAQRVKERGW